LKIAVNTRLLLANKLEGIGWFTFETLQRIVKAHPEHSFYFIFDRKYDESFIFSENVKPVVISPPARHVILQYLWFEFSVPYALKKIQPNIFISPDGYNSLRSPFKNLVVIHDLNFEHYPEKLPWLIKKYYRHYTPLFANKANRIATVSEFSKHDIVKQYGIAPDKIDVVYNGVNNSYVPVNETTKLSLKRKYSGGNDFFIFVGALIDRKNIENLFIAYDQFKRNSGSNIKLLIVGSKMWHNKQLEVTYENMEHKKDVIFTGRLTVEALCSLTASAMAMTYVSYFEGFGIPILEAFAAGVPVITSNVTSMPEVAGDAAILVNPHDVDEIASAMQQINNNKPLRDKLIEKGFDRCKNFSWDLSAHNLWLAIEKTLNS
jgi:glycosyltransferase involved in cell wall biosynthesis